MPEYSVGKGGHYSCSWNKLWERYSIQNIKNDEKI